MTRRLLFGMLIVLGVVACVGLYVESLSAATTVTLTPTTPYAAGNVLKGATITVPETIKATGGTNAKYTPKNIGPTGNVLHFGPAGTTPQAISTTAKTVAYGGVLGAYTPSLSIPATKITLTNSASVINTRAVTANVGWAKAVKAGFTGSTVLSASVAKGAIPALSSKVGSATGTTAGTLAAIATVPSGSQWVPNAGKTAWVAGPGAGTRIPIANLTGLVGSEATIIGGKHAATDNLAAKASVTMTWRPRTAAEAHSTPNGKPPMAAGGLADELWLTSDVVKIGGMGTNRFAGAGGQVYGLQMTFDNRINESFDGVTAGQAEMKKMQIVQLDSANKWAAVCTKYQGSTQSLAAFLAANSGNSLASLEGDWGIDPSSKANGKATTWAIVHGSGTFAVVPEPATIIMMVSATFGAIAYGWRRWTRRSRVVA